MITVGITNAPADAKYWRPYFQADYPGGQTFFPDQRLSLFERWRIDLFGELHFRVDLYDADQNIIYDYQTHFKPVTIVDSFDYDFNWGAETLEPVEPEPEPEPEPDRERLIKWGLIGGGLLIGMTLALRKKGWT